MELQRELDLPISSESLIPLRSFLVRCLEEGGIATDARRALMAGLDEALCAALVGKSEDRRRGILTVSIDINSTRVRVVLKDESDGAELSERPEEGLLQLASRPHQEMGLTLLRRVMDEIHYHYRRGFQNELELIKFL